MIRLRFFDRPKESCDVFGVFGHEDAAKLTYFGLYALQHRGQESGLKSVRPFPEGRKTFCIFEYIYFARPDSNVFGQNVYAVRKKLGQKLAQEYPIVADFAMPFPDSGTYAAIGFCQESGMPLEMGVIRNHYVGRTFIEPTQSMRDFGVKVKLNPVKEILNQKKVVIVEDSIIRGTTSRLRIKALREAGAWEVHMVVSCPPHRYPCYYGIDFPTQGELIASEHSIDEIKITLFIFLAENLKRTLAVSGLVDGSACKTEQGAFGSAPNR